MQRAQFSVTKAVGNEKQPTGLHFGWWCIGHCVADCGKEVVLRGVGI